MKKHFIKYRLEKSKTIGGFLRVSLVRVSWGTGYHNHLYFPIWPLAKPFILKFRTYC